MTKKPPAPPAPPPIVALDAPPPRVNRAGVGYAHMLADSVKAAYGVGTADTMDASENIGRPAGFVPWGNVAFKKAIGFDLPMGRIIEISGPEHCGKTTAADQILAAVQEIGGIGVLADTERSRDRKYMLSLGIQPETLVWVKANAMEAMFERVETITKLAGHYRNKAWADALGRAGYKMPTLPTEVYKVYDPASGKDPKRKPTAQWTLVQWSEAARAVVIQFQKDHSLDPNGYRDEATAAVLNPVILQNVDEKDKATITSVLANWENGVPDDRACSSEIPIVIVWDSVGGTPTEVEMQGSARDVNPAAAARVLRANIRRIVQMIDDQAVTWVMVNQEYEDIPIGWQPPGAKKGGKKTYGGGAIPYYASIRIRVDRGADIYAAGEPRDGGFDPVGQEVYFTVIKNRLGQSRVRGKYGLITGEGAVDAWTMMEALKEAKIIRSGGGWFRFVDPKILEDLGVPDIAWQRGYVGLHEMMLDVPGLQEVVEKLYLEGNDDHAGASSTSGGDNE